MLGPGAVYRLVSACGLAVLAAPAPAYADHPESDEAGASESLLDRLLDRLVVSVGGGVEGFINPPLRDAIGDGGTWNVRVSAGSRTAIRLELAYTGSAQTLDLEGEVEEDALLIGHGAHATIRVNVVPDLAIEPFFYLGAGWSRFHVRGRSTSSMIADVDHVLEVPFGIGAAYTAGRFVVDLRGGVSLVSGSDLLPMARDPDSSIDSAQMHRYGVRVNVGLEL